MVFNVLIVDSDKLIRWSLSEVFAFENSRVMTAGGYAAAVEQIERMSFGLIVIEFEIDDGDCTPLCDMIQKTQPQAALVLLTSLPAEKVPENLTDRPNLVVIEKPYDSDRLRALGRKAMAENVKRGIEK